MENAKGHAAEQAKNAAEQINKDLKGLKDITQAIANDLSSGKLQNEDLIVRLKKTIEDQGGEEKDGVTPTLFGVGAAYAPFEYDQDTELFATYLVFKPDIGEHRLEMVNYDYTLPDDPEGIRTEWYHGPLGGPHWNEPY